MFVLPGGRPGQMSSTPRGKWDGCLLGGQTRRRPDPPRPTPSRTARGMSWFWTRPLSFVRACDETFRTVAHNALGAKGAVVSPANRPAGVPPWLAPPHPAALPCAAPPQPARGVSRFWIRQNKMHIICPSCSRRQICAGTVFSSQERRALAVLLTNRG